MITEKSYLEALKIVANYNLQQKPTLIIRSSLQEGDKLICFAKGGGYGDTFTIQNPLYECGLILQCDKTGSYIPLKEVDLSDYELSI